MNIQFSGQNYDISESEKEQIIDGLKRLERQLGVLDAVQVYFSRERHLIKTEIQISSRSIKLIGSAETPDPFISIDTTIDRLVKQSQRYKKKRQDIRTHGEPEVSSDEDLHKRSRSSSVEEGETEPDVVRSERYIAKPMDLQDAILQLKTVKAEFFIFANAKSNHINVVYRRKDGKIGLIET